MQSNLNRALVGAVAALALVTLASPTFAQGRGGGGAGGASGGHMSTQGSVNTNGPTATDRDKGRVRAEDRMSTQGQTHSKAGDKGKTDKK